MEVKAELENNVKPELTDNGQSMENGHPVNEDVERSAFLAKVEAYYRERGTDWDPNPRIGTVNIDLFKLWKEVMARGGYDKVSSVPLQWREVAVAVGLHPYNNLPASGFSTKTAFYKNLAAYEIKTVHGKEPPPREILEDITAAGASLLTRTLENYRGKRDTSAVVSESGDDGTPGRESMNPDDLLNSGGRATRGLRQAPPQRILYQPDTRTSRQSHLAGSNMSTPGYQQRPYGYNNANENAAVSMYEPRPQVKMDLKPVITPGNNPAEFRKLQQMKDGKLKHAVQPKIMLPGTGYDGPNIYVRCLLALKSGIEAEQHYALHHLVKISMERGDKYRFESFAGLAEALVEKVLEVTPLVMNAHWEVVYPADGRERNEYTLDGLNGTPDVLQRLARFTMKDISDDIQTAGFASKMLLITQASLTLRNMVMLEDNARYVSEMKPLRDMLSIVLNLPNKQTFVEVKHNILDIVEQLTKYLHFDASDPLYNSLVSLLRSEDRGALLTTLRAMSRISMDLEEPNRLPNISETTLCRLRDLLLLDDEELVNAVLDFYYQYSGVPANVSKMILSDNFNMGNYIRQLTRLLSHGARVRTTEILIKEEQRRPAPQDIPDIPSDLADQLLPLPEPERSSKWLRCVFEEDKDEAITQIALWQAYQARFGRGTPAQQSARPPLLQASEFIKNVSTTFADKATAQVQSGPVQKFIIKGIRIRDSPVDLQGRTYRECKWVSDIETPRGRAMLPCNRAFIGQEAMYTHVLAEHVHASRNPDGQFVNEQKDYQCFWAGCKKYLSPHNLKTSQFAGHIKTHLPPDQDLEQLKLQKNAKPDWLTPAVVEKVTKIETPMDEHGDAAGISFTAVLVLRNLARNVKRTKVEEETLEEGGVSYVERLFFPVRGQLFDVVANNRVLAAYVADLLNIIEN